MSIKFPCVHCGHHLKAFTKQAGKHCKCPRCGQTLTVPASSPDGPVQKTSWLRWAIGSTLAAAVLASGIYLALLLYQSSHELDQKLTDLGGAVPQTRSAALLWLADAPVQDSRRAQITGTLEPLLFEGDVRGDLDPDVVLRAYLHWANQDNVPSLIRMVENPTLPHWSFEKTRRVMATLGNLHDQRAADALAAKLFDRHLRDQAVDALKLLGPGAENAVLPYLFVPDPATRERAGELLAAYGTRPNVILAESRRLLQSSDPEARRVAAEWFAANAPVDEAGKTDVARLLAAFLDDLSPEVNNLGLRGLKLWATRDCLPQMLAFATRQQKATDGKSAANNLLLIDVLAQFPDPSAAEAIATQLRNPEQRARASQALLKLGPKVATTAVLEYFDHPDEDVRKEARNLCRLLNVPDNRRVEQILADLANARKKRVAVALDSLSRLRPGEADRAQVSRALNAPLLDPDLAIRAAALEAVRVWATPANTATLVQLLGNLAVERTKGSFETADHIIQVLLSIGPGVENDVTPLLKSTDRVLRRQACYLLAEVGTSASVQPLQDAGKAYLVMDGEFYEQTKAAVAKIRARK
jgi:hypothetical protein